MCKRLGDFLFSAFSCFVSIHHVPPPSTHCLLTQWKSVDSRQLIKILNRLGATSSNNTHDHFVTHKVQVQQEKSVLDDLSAEVFTVATVDNFDVLRSRSAVYCGDQHRSYHGTTIELVQPNAMIEIPNGRTENGNGTEKKQSSGRENRRRQRKKGTRKDKIEEERREEDGRGRRGKRSRQGKKTGDRKSRSGENKVGFK